MATKRVVTKIERVEIVGMTCDRQKILDELYADGYRVTSSGPYTNKRMFPSVDPERFKLVAERVIE